MTRTTLRKRLLLSALENRVTPATYAVNALTDTGVGAGLVGDLRYCITQANANAGPDVIDATGVTGAILLSSELPAISDALTVNGPGATALNIDGNTASRLFQVSGTGSTLVNFTGLKFTNGGTTGNGGVASIGAATVTFDNCVLNNSFANVGGLLFGQAAADITVKNSTLSGSFATAGGGAIYSAGRLIIYGVTISGNSTDAFGSGGAIVLGGSGPSVITNSTLSGNTAGAHGGAIRTTSSFSGDTYLRNNTITQNTVVSSTGTGRGFSKGGSGGSINIVSTIVAQNTGGAVNTSDVNGSIKAAYSLFGTTDAAIITGNGNFMGTNVSPVNAKLGPLANNGGTRLTHLPMDDSPAREAGVTPDALEFDQRGPGYARTEGYYTDIGAVETLYFRPMAANIPIVVNEASPATTFQFTVTYFDPRGSQMLDYSSLGTGDLYIIGTTTTYFAIPTFISATPSADAQTIVATYEMPVPVNGQPGWDISDNGIFLLVTYAGEVYDNDAPTPLDADPVGFVFLHVEIPVIYTVDEATDVVDGKTGAGELSLREAINIANSDNQFSTIAFDPVVFGGPTTITLTGGELPITASVNIDGPGATKLTISGNNVSRIFNVDGPGVLNVSLSGLKLTQGFSADQGGAVYCNGENLTVSNCDISQNRAILYGGGIRTRPGGLLTLTDSLVANNTAGAAGGVAAMGGAIVRRSTIISNIGEDFVGGIVAEKFFLMEDSLVYANSSKNNNCGGIQLQGSFSPPPTIRNSTISANFAYTWGGGIVLIHTSAGSPFTGPLVVENSTIVSNGAVYDGGGIWQDPANNGTITAESSIITGNYDYYYAADDIYTLGTANLMNCLVGTTSGITMPVLAGSTAALLGLNPKIGLLANNGGPTKTHALLPGSPAINAGSNSAGLSFDQRGVGFSRSVGQTDIGAFEVNVTKITSVQINDGSAQRSRITSVTLSFDYPLNLLGALADAFQLKRQSDNAPVTVNAESSGNMVTLTFTGGAIENASLADGRYTLTVLADQILNLDGDGNGTTGDNHVLASETNTTLPPTNIFRLFGDITGDGAVSGADFNLFRTAFGGSDPIFDFDNDGFVGNSDFNQFKTRFGASI